jgi:hypothetical protein
VARRFRIALSFAGDRRAYVAEAAAVLAARFGRESILYDKYHEAEFARGDLGFHLPRLYFEDSDLVVVVLCDGYDKREWCGLEWNAIYGRLKQRQYDNVMLTRFDRVEGEGLFGLAGFIDLDEKPSADFARLIQERLAINEGRPRDFYMQPAGAGPDWPAVAPALDWPVADHTEARRAFAELITRAAPFRVLPIHGVSETGKSLLTKQFLRNALKIPDLVCGRYDFKGSSDMDAELRAFAERLEVPAPTPGGSASTQLAQIFGAVKKAARPTLLIFDTFELAGEAERWMKENLLLSVISAAWLRVIVVGQRIAKPHGEPWAGVSAEPVELRPPTPEEWFAYGQAHNPSPQFTIEFVRSAHTFAKGKSSVLAQLCGPNA